MAITVIRQSLCTRLLAAFIVLLVVSPYSEPFATLDGTDFGGAGAVEVSGGSKFKPSTDDMLADPLVVAAFGHVFLAAVKPNMSAVTPDSRHGRRAILRL